MNKKINSVLSIFMISLFLITSTAQKTRAQDVSVSYQTFYDNLAPYGQWVSDPQYGNVWVPNEGGDFRPYGSRGHWVMTDYGNTWVSDDPWGWACYHYGRWTYDPYYGWVWIPGYEWAPSWVSWRFGGGYSGWAPLGPGDGNCPNSWWVFVAPQYMYSDDCFHHWRGPNYNGDYIRQTTVVNNYYADNHTHVRYNYGPRADAIQGVTHQPVKVYHVSQNTRPGAASVSGNNVSIYRPSINKATASSARPANVVAAPKAIGAPHENNTLSASKQPAFRAQVQNTTHGNAAANNTNTQRPAPTNHAPSNNTLPQSQNNNKPAPQQRPQPQPQQRPQPAPQQRPQPQPQQRPQPALQQRPQPQPQQRPQPAPQQRPQPQQQQKPQPQQQQRPQPAPEQHNEAPHEEPHEGGRR